MVLWLFGGLIAVNTLFESIVTFSFVKDAVRNNTPYGLEDQDLIINTELIGLILLIGGTVCLLSCLLGCLNSLKTG